MRQRNQETRPSLKWDVMDVREMTYDSNIFDLIIDKSTIDALLCGENAFINVAMMLKECQRVMKVNSFYMGISYGSPGSRMLHYKRSHLRFDLQVIEILPKDPRDSLHYIYANKKIEGADE